MKALSRTRLSGAFWGIMTNAAIEILVCITSDSAAAEPHDGQSFWLADGPAVFAASPGYQTNVLPFPRVYAPPPERLPVELRRSLLQFLVPQQSVFRVQAITNLTFHHFAPESLQNAVWTNFISQTNGRSTLVWSTRDHPPGWPATPPRVAWNHQSLLWGRKGLTALSPCWEGEGLSGQVPVTALTRRHGYTRGHSMGPAGFHKNFAGKKVWFVTRSNELVERRIAREVVHIGGIDYTLFLFDRDLPAAIEPLRVAHLADFVGPGPVRYPFCEKAPYLFLKTEQTGHVSADIPGFTLNTWKGGDSGSPNMLPLSNELIFVSGRSTSGASPGMQADMDELCRLEHLEPRAYQLRWVDLSAFPRY